MPPVSRPVTVHVVWCLPTPTSSRLITTPCFPWPFYCKARRAGPSFGPWHLPSLLSGKPALIRLVPRWPRTSLAFCLSSKVTSAGTSQAQRAHVPVSCFISCQAQTNSECTLLNYFLLIYQLSLPRPRMGREPCCVSNTKASAWHVVGAQGRLRGWTAFRRACRTGYITSLFAH